MPDGSRVKPGHLEELRVLGAQSHSVKNGAVDLHVLDYGGERPPLLVLPGITSPAITWDFVVSELRDLVRPLVLDLRGRGLSGPGEGYASEDFAEDAECVIEALGLRRPVVLGHSLGARVGAALAARGRVALGGTILVDPPLSGPTRGPYPTSREAFLQQLSEGYAGTTADEVSRYYPRWPRGELLLRARWVATCEQAAVLATYDEFTREDFFDWWPRVPAPCAFMRGGESPVVSAAGAVESAELNPLASQHVVPGAGHMVPWDSYALFMAELRPLLESQLANASAAGAGS